MKTQLKKQYIYICCVILALGTLSSCHDDLDRLPTNGMNGDQLYNSVDGYKNEMITIYSQISSGYFIREFWNMQEIPTDEAIMTWDDPQGTFSFNSIEWNADNSAIYEFYSMVMYNITLCNNFIIESSDANLNERGFSEDDKQTIKTFIAEVKFLRAYFYWTMLDLFGNPPFATVETLTKGIAPEQIKQSALFDYLVSELTDIDESDALPDRNEYGRVSKSAVWALFARLYLNAETYSGTKHYTEAISYSNKVINAGYSLEKNYNWLMLGDNHLNTNEFIFTANFDNEKMLVWGGTSYLALGPANVPKSVNGMSDSWTSLRVRPSFVSLFPSADTLTDKRGAFWTSTQSLEIDNIADYNQGYSVFKYRNLDRSGNPIPQNNIYNNISDIDFPLFRLGEIYLIYAESVLRGGTGGDNATALTYINKLRGRAYANNPESTNGNISSGQLTLNFILDERARELYWEGHRRTDLIRYGKFTSADYLWEWKGGAATGMAVGDKYKLYPIPATDLVANSNLEQNPGGY
mgnify:CR=1 FL=1